VNTLGFEAGSEASPRESPHVFLGHFVADDEAGCAAASGRCDCVNPRAGTKFEVTPAVRTDEGGILTVIVVLYGRDGSDPLRMRPSTMTMVVEAAYRRCFVALTGRGGRRHGQPAPFSPRVTTCGPLTDLLRLSTNHERLLLRSRKIRN